jgi:hypothetical protein
MFTIILEMPPGFALEIVGISVAIIFEPRPIPHSAPGKLIALRDETRPTTKKPVSLLWRLAQAETLLRFGVLAVQLVTRNRASPSPLLHQEKRPVKAKLEDRMTVMENRTNPNENDSHRL